MIDFVKNDIFLQVKTFLTFSSRALRNNPDWYLELVKVVEQSGAKIEYRWFEHLAPKTTQKIYDTCIANIKNSQLLIADATEPSVGVGQQIQFSSTNKIPTILIYNEAKAGNHLSSLFGNYQSSLVTIIKYSDFSDLKENLKEAIKRSRDTKLEKLNFIATSEIKKVIKAESTKLHVSQSELLRRIVNNWIKANHE